MAKNQDEINSDFLESLEAEAYKALSSADLFEDDNEEEEEEEEIHNQEEATTPHNNPTAAALPNVGHAGTTDGDEVLPSTEGQKRKYTTRPFDGKRGIEAEQGRWISFAEASKRAGKEDWWTSSQIDGKVVKAEQHVKDAPKDKPVWLYEDRMMYLGGWKRHKKDGVPVEHGFGIMYHNDPQKWKGLIIIGAFQNGVACGYGELFYLKSSKTWISNHLPGSLIKRGGTGTGKPRGVPFHYMGEFQKGEMCGLDAIVTLKDGTTRKGPWLRGEPEGKWDDEHESVPAPVRKTKNTKQNDTAFDNGAAAGRSNLGQGSAQLTAKSNKTHPTPARKKRKVHAPVAAAKRPATPTQPTTNSSKRRRSHARQPSAATVTARSGSGKERIVIKQDPDEVIDIPSDTEEEDSDASDDGDRKPAATTEVNLAEIGGGSAKALSSEEAKRIQQICDWITHDVIGSDPLPATMKNYANKLFQEGFESLKMIKDHLEVEDIKSYNWMRPLHKKIFQGRIRDGW